MANTPEDRKYTRDHAWVRIAADGRVRTGLTDVARRRLGPAVSLELPGPGERFEASDVCATVVSAEAVTEVRAPMSGTVAEVNPALDGAPGTLDADPYGDGWLLELTVDKPAQLDGLLTPAGYADFCRENLPDV
ncbi:glycine cleavage system protein GcvH [Streptomyces sp. TRM70308]|uniref:glycine cleavage system protein H n=1 Tax=Streptomyces sp. TRM70308 TaxID=3131932 RepID=UPI003CFF9DF1